MSIREKFPWARFGFEGVLIIVSILAAFSIEEWRQGREDAEQERVLLEALAEDFEQAARAYDEERAAHARVAANGEKIILIADSGGVPESGRDEFQDLVGSHFNRALFKPPTGTVETILGSGRIDLISNRQLVAELTRWSSVVERLNTLEEEARDHFYGRIYPYLLTRLNLKDLDRGYRDYFPEFPFDQRPVDAYRLIDDEAFIGMVYMHWVLKTNILSAMEPVEASLKRIQALVAKELGDG